MAKAQVHLLPAARNTVMVVDDQSTGRAILEQVVRSLDERVVVEGFARPVDAVVWATRHVADLVLVDYMMPDMDGIELVGRLRSLPGYEHVPIVMVTAQSEEWKVMKARDVGITEFLVKPFSAKTMARRITVVIENPRQFVRTDDFFGPDRRRHRVSTYTGEERRKDMMEKGDQQMSDDAVEKLLNEI